MSPATIFFQMLSLLLMIGAGWLATKTGLLDEYTNGKLSPLIVNLFNPLLILTNGANAVGNIAPETLGLLVLISAAMFAFLILAGMVLTPRFTKDDRQGKIYQLMFVFSNLGFIGIPVVSSILGSRYVVYVTVFVLMYNVVFYTYGLGWMEGRLSLTALRAMINPGNLCCVAALVLVLCNLRLPDFVLTATDYLGNVTTPLALMSVGYGLANGDLREIFGRPKLYLFSAIKLLLLPIVMMLPLCLVFPASDLLPVCLVMFGMPVGNMPLMLANQKGIDARDCTALIILTTVLCVATIPVLLALFL